MAPASRRGARTPSRTCVGCGRVREKRQLLRITVAGSSARVDPKGRLPGRGLYVCREEACVALAEKRGAFSRWIDAGAARALFEELRAAIAGGADRDDEGVLALVGLARRAGHVAAGLRNVLEGLARGEGRVLVTARDISQRGAIAAMRAAREAGVPQVVAGTRVTLGVALGAGETVAALVVEEKSAKGILERAVAPSDGAAAPASG